MRPGVSATPTVLFVVNILKPPDKNLNTVCLFSHPACLMAACLVAATSRGSLHFLAKPGPCAQPKPRTPLHTGDLRAACVPCRLRQSGQTGWEEWGRQALPESPAWTPSVRAEPAVCLFHGCSGGRGRHMHTAATGAHATMPLLLSSVRKLYA